MTERRDAIRRPGPNTSGSDHPDGELIQEITRLRRRVAELEERSAPWHRLRTVSTAILTLLTVVAVPATAVAAWVQGTALETDRFMEVVEPVLATPEVDAALTARLTADVLEALDLEMRLEARLVDLGLVINDALADALDLSPTQRARIDTLPLPELQDLAAPIASGLEARIAIGLEQFVGSPEFERLLIEGTEIAHTKAVALLRGDDQLPNVEVEAGEVRLNLLPIVARVLEDGVDRSLASVGIEEIPFIDPFEDPEVALDRLATALDTDLPADFGQLTIMSEAELAELQTAARLADQLAWALASLSVGLLTATIAVAPRRRRVLAHLGLGTGAAVAVTMAFVRSTEDEIASLAVTRQGRGALSLLASSTFGSLRSVMVVVLAVALGVAAVAHLLGRPRWMVRAAAWLRQVRTSKPGGSDLQRFGLRYHDALRISVVASAVLILFLVGLDLWTLLILAAIVPLGLWGLGALRSRAAHASADVDASAGDQPLGTREVARIDDQPIDLGGGAVSAEPDGPVGQPQM